MPNGGRRGVNQNDVGLSHSHRLVRSCQAWTVVILGHGRCTLEFCLTRCPQDGEPLEIRMPGFYLVPRRRIAGEIGIGMSSARWLRQLPYDALPGSSLVTFVIHSSPRSRIKAIIHLKHWSIRVKRNTNSKVHVQTQCRGKHHKPTADQID